MTVAAPSKASSGSSDPYSQSGFGVRFDWGLQGATTIAAGAAAVVVVDVLSFGTTLSVAVDAGIQVFPYRFRDASAAAFAATRGALLAVGRREAGPSGVSLSPVSVRRGAAPGGPLATTMKLVLPSPNGAAICRQLGEAGALVVGASLRNGSACAEWVVKAVRGPIAVIAAGERWPSDVLRPAVEDLWGAGLVIDALANAGAGPVSPEAASARAAYRGLGRNPAMALAACASGRELAEGGYGEEIAVAAETDVSRRVPVLEGDSFRVG
jgi:2-phosphosulfolactate phosphatase